MKRIFIFLAILIFASSGCAIRVIPKKMDRVDQELKGNRGIIRGSREGLPAPGQEKKTRTVYDVEIEFTSFMDIEEEPKPEKEAAPLKKEPAGYGNKGYITRRSVPEKSLRPVALEKKSRVQRVSPGPVREEAPTPLPGRDKYRKEKGEGTVIEIVTPQPRTYVVQKGDTLQKVSQKMYGTTKKWRLIYDANKEKIKDPDRIHVGQELIIP